MFAKLLLALPALAILAAATPAPAALAESCSTGPIQCCESVQPAGSAAATSLLASIGVLVQDVTTPIGITCSPISVVGVGGSDACSQADTVCCEDNAFGGLISIGCVPISV